jgi:hypothetical protein
MLAAFLLVGTLIKFLTVKHPFHIVVRKSKSGLNHRVQPIVRDLQLEQKSGNSYS